MPRYMIRQTAPDAHRASFLVWERVTAAIGNDDTYQVVEVKTNPRYPDQHEVWFYCIDLSHRQMGELAVALGHGDAPGSTQPVEARNNDTHSKHF